MIFLIGAAALFAAWWGLGSGTRRGGARAWAALAVAALPLIALFASRHDLDRYRFTLLATRYRLAETDTLIVSGDPETADLLVPGGGERPLAVLAPRGDSAVVAVARRDASALLLVQEDRPLGDDAYHALGAVPLEEGDTLEVAGWRLILETAPDTLAGVPVPWARMHVVRAVGGATPWLDDAAASGAASPQADGEAPGAGSAVALPPVGGWRRWIAPRRPGILERSYPLADILDRIAPEEGAGRPGLSSFLFYDDAGRPSLALLDSEVRVAARSPRALPVWTAEDGGRRVLVAGLPLRDFAEPELTLPERYGARPLRSVRFGVTEGWLEARPSRPEIHALDRAALEELDIGGGPAASDDYRIRLSPGRGTLLRQAVVFGTPARGFAAAGQAVFILPRDPAGSAVEVVTPSGFAHWRAHHPISLGDDARTVLLRVDGQAASVGTLLAYALLLGLAASVFSIWPVSGRVYALAVLALGLAGVRLLLGLSAHADLPYDQEAQQLALWVVPFLPWMVVVAGEVGAALRRPLSEGSVGGDTIESPSPRWTWHGAFVVALASLAWVLFADSPAKRLVLAALPLGLLAVLLVARARGGAAASVDAAGHARGSSRGGAGGTSRAAGQRRARLRRGLSDRMRALTHPQEPRATLRNALLGPGLRLGLPLLILRALMAVAGAREQVVLLGTRVGVSVLYTPLSLLALAWILWRGGRRIAGVRGERADREGAWLLVNVGVFALLAFAGVSVAISDYGIVFTTLPGALVLLLALGWRYAPRTTRPGVAAAVLAAPLALFVAVQVSPSILHPWGAGDATRLEGRMAEWSRNELLLLEREDPQALRLIGQRRSEALAVMRETMRSYTRGNWTGRGFLQGRVSEEVRPTSTREHVPSALLAGQWGLAGTVGLLMLLGGLLVPLRGGSRSAGATDARAAGRGAADGRAPVTGSTASARAPAGAIVLAALAFLAAVALLPRPFGFVAAAMLSVAVGAVLLPVLQGDAAPAEARDSQDAPGFAMLLAGTFLATLAFAGIYIVLANWGWVLFTGKNVYLLGLDSVSDLLESTMLLAPAAAAVAFSDDGPAASRATPLLRRPSRMMLPRRPS